MYYSALIGNPVEHSISPMFFSFIADKLNMEYAHIKVKVKSSEDLEKMLFYFKELGFCGLNITIPYKIDVYSFVDIIDESADIIKSVNTIVFKDNKLFGYNTDGKAAINSIENHLMKIDKNTKVVLIGAGGAGRPICYELYKKTKNITVLNRYEDEALEMIKLISNNIVFKDLSDKNIIESLNNADLIINSTPVGMYPNINENIIKEEIWNKINNVSSKKFFDVIFNPYKTKFLKEAEKRNAETCSGLLMMIYQIMSAFELWTGLKTNFIDVKAAENEISKKMKNIF